MSTRATSTFPSLVLAKQRRSLKAPALSVVSILLLPMAWIVVTEMQWVSPLFLPPPLEVLAAARELMASGVLWEHLGISAFRIFTGFLLAVAAGSVVGILIGRFSLLADFLEPVIDLLRQISPVAWIPLAIIWFGFSEAAKIYIVFLGAFFPTVVNAADGIRGVKPQIINAARSLGAGEWQLFTRVSLPATLPYLFSGITIGLGNCVRFVVAAELTGATTGLGYMMMSAREVMRTEVVLVGMVAMALLGVAAMSLMLALRQRLLRWHIGRG